MDDGLTKSVDLTMFYIPPIEEPIRSDEEVIRLMLRDKKAGLLWNGDWEQVTDENGNEKEVKFD